MIVSSARNSPLGTLCKADYFLAGESVLIFSLKNTALNNSFDLIITQLLQGGCYYYSHFTDKETEVEDNL